MRYFMLFCGIWLNVLPAFAVPPLSRVHAPATGGANAPDVMLSREANGQIRWARGTVDEPSELGALGPAAAAAIAYVRASPKFFPVRPDEKWLMRADEIDNSGIRHVKLSRQIYGIAVEFDEIRLHARNGFMHAIENDLSDLAALRAPIGVMAPQRALQLAKGNQALVLTQPPQTTLVILPNRLTHRGDRYAWRSRIAFERGAQQTPVHRQVYIDALNGRLLASLSRLMTDGSPTTVPSVDLYGNSVNVQAAQFKTGVLLKDVVTVKGGSIATLDASNLNVGYTTPTADTPFSDATSVSVANNVRTAVDFYKQQFTFATWDMQTTPAGPGGLIQAKAHYGKAYNNAYFTTNTVNGVVIATMVFGDGDYFTPLAKCLDVTGHEMGHALVNATADLVYHNQSGALNEHFADVFGWLMDQKDDTIGEDCMGPGQKPLRNLCNPAEGNSEQPAKMSQFVKLADDEKHDHGGVHVNSGIPNRAACVARNNLGDGGAVKVGKVWFQTLKSHLGATSTFDDMVAGNATACAEVGLSADDCGKIQAGWVDVGLATAQAGGACPANSSASSGGCTCNANFTPNSEGSACVPVAAVTCPANAHADSGDCYCDDGYVPDGKQGCTSSNGKAGKVTCPEHAHLDGSECVCDDCYQGATTGDSAGCAAIKGCGVCSDPGQTSKDGSCQCIDGVKIDVKTNKCEAPIAGQCGHETFGGRCVGSSLVYCDDGDPAVAKAVSIIDCATLDNKVCAWDSEGAGYDCIPPKSNCGDVTETGKCAGQVAQWCDSGVLQKLDCGIVGCGPFDLNGVSVQFCKCPANASRDLTGECQCDTGFHAQDHACVKGAGDTALGNPPAGSPVGSGGCSAGAGAGAGAWFWVVGGILSAFGWHKRKVALRATRG